MSVNIQGLEERVSGLCDIRRGAVLMKDGTGANHSL